MIKSAQIALILTSLLVAGTVFGGGYEAKDFFRPTNTQDAQLSPDGKYVATISQTGDDQQLLLWDSQSRRKKVLIDLDTITPRDASIRFIRWIGPNHIAAQFFELKKGIKYLLDTKARYRLLIIELPLGAKSHPTIYELKTRGWLVHSLPEQSESFLYAKGGVYSKLYKISVKGLNEYGKKLGKLVRKDGGQFTKENEVASVKGHATRWFIDDNGDPNTVLHFSDNSLNLSLINEGKKAENLKSWPKDKLDSDPDPKAEHGLLVPVARSNKAKTFYCLDIDAEEDRVVYSCDFETGKEEIVYQADAYKIVDLILSGSPGELIGVKVLRNGALRHQYMDAGHATGGTNDSQINTRIGESLDGNAEVYYEESHDKPGRYILKYAKNRGDFHVGSRYPHLDNRLKNKQVHGSVSVEGLEIPYLLTLPVGRKPVPLIVMPHGGPIGVFDDGYFDLFTQFFSANNYAVLRVNFRGSSGYSPRLQEAGKRQWGKLMLEDIYRATLEVSQRKEIDASRICAVGMSYGGYASLMMVIRHEELFRCAVNIAGVTDVNLHLNSPETSKKQDSWLKEQVGDPVNDYKELKDISPIYLAKNINRPLYIIHGEKDTVVDIEHAYRLRLMLEKYGKFYRWKTFSEMGHEIGGSETRIEIFDGIMSFLGEHI